MPTYQYRCHDCRHELEAQQAFSDDPLTECPSCGGTLKKRFSSVGISFKGSGFYKTDSRGSSSRPASSTTAAETSSGSDSSSGSTPAPGSSDSGSSGSSDKGSSGSGGSSSPAATAATA